MKAAATPPLCASSWNYGSIKFALAHELQKSSEYLNLVKSYVKKGDYVILDNGTDELGESIESGDLAELAFEIKPTVLILPDVLYNGDETIRRTEDFIEFHENQPCDKYMGVAQGKSYTEWLNCYIRLIGNPYIKLVGISYDLDFEVSPFLTEYCKKNSYNREQTRAETRQYVVTKLFSTGMVTKPLHLLGWNTLDELRQFQTLNEPLIQSHDAASAFSAGAEGFIWAGGISGEKNWKHLEFDISKEEWEKVDKDIVVYNLLAYYSSCGDYGALYRVAKYMKVEDIGREP